MTYVPRRAPWKHQREAAERLRGRKAFALLMAMRTGKTKVTLDDWGTLEDAGEVDDLLVIAPAGVYRTWETAIDDHLSASLLPRVNVFCWSAGMGAAATRRLGDFLSARDRPRILLVNVEALSVVDRAKKLCSEFLSQRRAMCVIDEPTTIKSPSAKRAKFVARELGPLASHRRILSGLITPRSPLDLYMPFYFLDPKILGFKSWYGFRARYAVLTPMFFGGRSVPVIVGYRDEEGLRAAIEPHSFRVRLEDCYDLPPKMYSIREVSLSDEQKRIYAELKHFATAALGEERFVTASQVIVQILRMHQVLCGHTTDEKGHPAEIPENRTRELLDLLEEHEGKAIVWCSYDIDVRKVSAAIEKRFATGEGPSLKLAKVARFWGGNRKSREDEEKTFLTDPECRHMVATAAAGGRGRTWTVADLVVYYSNSSDLEHRSQSEERAQGVDKVRSVAYVDLVARGTVDEKILNALRKKIDMAATINGDTWREWIV